MPESPLLLNPSTCLNACAWAPFAVLKLIFNIDSRISVRSGCSYWLCDYGLRLAIG